MASDLPEIVFIKSKPKYIISGIWVGMAFEHDGEHRVEYIKKEVSDKKIKEACLVQPARNEEGK